MRNRYISFWVPSLSTWHFLLFFSVSFYFLGVWFFWSGHAGYDDGREKELCNSNISHVTGPRQSFLPFLPPVVYAFPFAAGGAWWRRLSIIERISKSRKSERQKQSNPCPPACLPLTTHADETTRKRSDASQTRNQINGKEKNKTN